MLVCLGFELFWRVYLFGLFFFPSHHMEIHSPEKNRFIKRKQGIFRICMEKTDETTAREERENLFLILSTSKLQCVCRFYRAVKCSLHFALLKRNSRSWLITRKLHSQEEELRVGRLTARNFTLRSRQVLSIYLQLV